MADHPDSPSPNFKTYPLAGVIRYIENLGADSPASALALPLTLQAGYLVLLYLVRRSPNERRRYLIDPSRLHRLERLENVSSG